MNTAKSAKIQIQSFLEDLQSFVQKNQLSNEYVDAIKTLQDNLDRQLTLLVLGEVNAGKSSLINALLGEDVCPVAALPCTDRIYELCYGKKQQDMVLSDQKSRIILPNKVLKDITIVDTPGTNSTVWAHNDITTSYIPNADIVLAVLPAKNPFGQSLWDLMIKVKEIEQKKIIFILQQCDMVKADDLKSNQEYIQNFALEKGFSAPIVLPVSVRRYRAGEIEQSGWNLLQEQLQQTLSLFGNADNLLISKMSGIEALLQKIAAEFEETENKLAYRSQMNSQIEEIQSKNRKDGLVVLEQYSADFNSILDELERHVSELCHGKARYKDLKRPGRVQEYFELAHQRCDSRCTKLAEEFIDALSGGYHRVQKRTAAVLTDRKDAARMNRRNAYEQIDATGDQLLAISKTEAKRIVIAKEPLDNIAQECVTKSRKIMQRANRRFWIITLFPVALYLIIAHILPLVMSVIAAALSQPEESSFWGSIGSAITEGVSQGVQAKLFSGGDSSGLFGVVGVLVLIILVLIYVPIVAAIVRKWATAQLEVCAIDAYNQLKQQREVLYKKLYNSMLQMLDAIDDKFYSMYRDVLDEHTQTGSNASEAVQAFGEIKQQWNMVRNEYNHARR